MKKITMMANLTLYVNKSEYKIEIDEKFTKVSSLDEIEDLEHSLSGFFDVESIGRQNNKIYLVYNLPEGYQPLEKAKNYVPVIKLQLIKNLLDIDPLLEVDGMTYLDLNNIYFKNFNNIKILYRSNSFLPFHNDLSILDQYKHFIFGFYSDKHSYKRFLINKDNLLAKENNDFMFAVNAATSFAELKNIVDRELEKEQSSFYEKAQFLETSQKKGYKRKLYLSGLLILLTALVFAGSIKQIEKNIAVNYQEELASARAENELILAVSSGDTKKAIKLMEDKGEEPAAIADMLVQVGKYDDAIAYDKTIEKKVVSQLYKINQEGKILELKSESPFLTFEKEIVEFNSDNLVAKAPLIEDKDTLKRLALAFIKHDNYEFAKDILERLKANSADLYALNETEIKEIEQYIKKVELEIQVKNLNEQITFLKQKDTLEEKEEDRINREEHIKELEDELVKTQKELIKRDEKIGMDA